MQRSLLVSIIWLAACGGAATGPAPQPTARARRHSAKPRGSIPADFAVREGLIYRSLDPLVRACTIKVNARAGLKWLELVTGKPASELSSADRISEAAQAVSGGGKLSEGELADAGWLVAETVRRHRGGQYRMSAQGREVALAQGPGRQLNPMRLIQGAHGGQDLDQLVGQVSGDLPPDRLRCAGVRPADVLRYRLSRR